jgi:hypothetical protein
VNHQRHVIREAITALLAAGGTAAGARVYDSPTDPRTAFPALVVEDLGEDQRANTMPGGSARPIERRLSIEVTAEVQQAAAFARVRDQLLADVESLLAAAVISGVKWIVPTGFAPDRDGSGERPISIGRQRFEVMYVTTQGNPAAMY